MSYPFVQAAHDYGPRKGPVKAFVVHMAEGGGTVGYLSRPNPRGVSVHYVIQYSGRIVQMLREDHASGSINANDLRTGDGPAPYGASVRRQVMGAWDRDPNSAAITLELEGFAVSGPNVSQRSALGRLVADVRRRYPNMGLLGHRDFTMRKACPGAHIPWASLGGHGPAQQEQESLMIYTRELTPGTFFIPSGARVSGYSLKGDKPTVARVWDDHSASTGTFRAVLRSTNGESPSPLLEVSDDGFFKGLYVPASQVDETFTPLPGDDCSVQDQKIAEAIAVLSA